MSEIGSIPAMTEQSIIGPDSLDIDTLRNAIYLNALHALGKKGVDYCVLRNQPEQEKKLKDLDVLIHPKDADEFIEICGEIGYAQIRSRAINPFKFVLSAHISKEFWTLDVHTEVISRGLVYMDRDQVLTRKRTSMGYSYPSNEDLLISLIFHNLIGKQSFLPKYIQKVSRLLSLKLDHVYIREHTSRYGLWKIFEICLHDFQKISTDPVMFLSLKKQTYKALRLKRPFNVFLQPWVRMKRKWGWIYPLNRGVSIAFIGPDGMGKSTLIQSLEKYFAKYPFGVSRTYLGPWGNYRLPLWEKAKKLHLSPYSKVNSPRFSFQFLKVLIRGSLYYLLLWCELWYRFFKDVIPGIQRGKIILIDRYVYDILIGHRNKRLSSFHCVRKLFVKFFPPPHLLFLLDGPSEVVARRKTGLSVDEMTDLRVRYKVLVQTPQLKRTDVQILKVDRPFSELISDVIGIIWKKVVEH